VLCLIGHSSSTRRLASGPSSAHVLRADHERVQSMPAKLCVTGLLRNADLTPRRSASVRRRQCQQQLERTNCLSALGRLLRDMIREELST